MAEVLIISAEPRLVSAVKDVLEKGTGVHTTSVDRWARGQALLFKDRFDLVVLDYECLKLEALDAFITIDNILQKEKTSGILLVRQMSERAAQIENSLQALQTTIDMSKGKPNFARELSQFRDEIDVRSSLTQDDSVELSREIGNFLNVEFELPEVSSGSLKQTSLMRLLYTCRIRKSSGIMTIKSGNRSVRLGLDVGNAVLPSGGPTRADLLSTFGWVGGEFQFQEGAAPAGSKEAMFELLRDGISRLNQPQLHERFEPLMEKIPVQTNLWEDRQDTFDEYVALLGLMRMCDGKTRWDEVLNRMGSMANEAFKAAYFAIETDLIWTQEKAGVQGVLITYGRGVRQARQAVAESERQSTKAFRAESDDRTVFEAELFAQLAGMREATAHENFDIWEGCGRDVVRNRFYELVKEYHPDVYGGNVTGRVRTLAQEIFILFKANYQELLKVEREQTVPPPDSHLSESSLSERSESMSFARSEGTNPRRRPTHETPGPENRENTATRTKSSIGSTMFPNSDEPSASAIPATPAESRETKKNDVKSKIEKLSGFRRREARRRNRRISTPGDGLDMGSEIQQSEFSEASEAEQIEEEKPPEVPPEVAARQAKLDALKKKAEASRGPNAPDPAKEAFNEGYRAFREERLDEAFLSFKTAYEKDPEDGLYLTFYGYLVFRLDPTRIDEAEELVRKALQTGNRQAMPDACLFLGYIFKARGDEDRAYKQFQRAYRLNPASVDAEREIRLADRRKKRRTSEPGTFIKNLFKK